MWANRIFHIPSFSLHSSAGRFTFLLLTHCLTFLRRSLTMETQRWRPVRVRQSLPRCHTLFSSLLQKCCFLLSACGFQPATIKATPVHSERGWVLCWFYWFLLQWKSMGGWCNCRLSLLLHVTVPPPLAASSGFVMSTMMEIVWLHTWCVWVCVMCTAAIKGWFIHLSLLVTLGSYISCWCCV